MKINYTHAEYYDRPSRRHSAMIFLGCGIGLVVVVVLWLT